MPRQQLELGRLVIRKGERASSEVKLHGDTVVLTVYVPELTGDTAEVQVSPDGSDSYLTYVHKGIPVRLARGRAFDVPIPACRSLRVISSADEESERTFHVLELLEM